MVCSDAPISLTVSRALSSRSIVTASVAGFTARTTPHWSPPAPHPTTSEAVWWSLVVFAAVASHAVLFLVFGVDLVAKWLPSFVLTPPPARAGLAPGAGPLCVVRRRSVAVSNEFTELTELAYEGGQLLSPTPVVGTPSGSPTSVLTASSDRVRDGEIR